MSLAPLIREFKIDFYTRARRALQKRDPTHADLPEIVRRLHQLESERPPMALKPRSPCPAFMCAGHPDCADRHCSRRVWGTPR